MAIKHKTTERRHGMKRSESGASSRATETGRRADAAETLLEGDMA